jgi:uncharacterized coiled-coil protein SlyX
MMKLKKKLKKYREKFESSRVNSTNPPHMTWDQDKK